jgi:chromosome segregation ATPase
LIRENERLKDKFANVDNHTRICLHGRRVDEAADRALYPVPSSSPDHHLHHHHHHHRSCEDVRSAVEQSHMQMHNNCLKNQVHQLHSGALNHEQNHLQEFGSLQKDLKDSLEENAELKRRVRDLNALRSSMKDKIDLLTKKQEILLKSRTPDHDKVQELITYIERQRDVYKSSVERLIGKLDPDGTHLERSLMVEGEKGSGGSRDRVATIHSKPTSNLQVLTDIQNQSRKVLSQQQEGRHSSVQIVSSTSRAETSDFENSYHPSQYRNATNPSSAQSTNASRSTSVGQTEKPSQNRTSAEDRDTVKQILHLESEVDRVKQALSQLRQEKSEVQNELRAQVETLQSENANLRENFELLESQQKQSEKKAKAADMFPSSLSDLKRRLAEQTAAVAEFERQVETKQTHLQKMSDDKDQMQNLLDEKTVQLVEVKQRMSDAEAGRARAEADRTVAEQRLHQCLAELSKQNARLEDGESRSKAIRKRQTAEKAVGVDLRRENERRVVPYHTFWQTSFKTINYFQSQRFNPLQ